MSEFNSNNTTLDNLDLVRIVFWFCSEGDPKIFKSNIRLQKIVFLAQKELPEFQQLKEQAVYNGEEFEFEANNFGPFSVDLVKLVNGKFKTEGKEIIIKKIGFLTTYEVQDTLKEKLKEKYSKLKDNNTFLNWVKKISVLGKLDTGILLKKVYENVDYSNYLAKSIIAHKFNL